MNDYRESIWGIQPRDRGWFQLITLIGGTSGSIVLTLLELDSLFAGAVVTSEVARNITLGIGASFVASGFISWGLLQAREIPMLIADWIRDSTRKRRERLLEEGRRQGRLEVLREIYGPDYSDPGEGKHPQPPDGFDTNGTDGGDNDQ